MEAIPADLLDHLRAHGQEHAVAFWDRLTPAERRGLVDQLRALDLEELGRLYRQREQPAAVQLPDEIRPLPIIPHPADEDAEARRRGEAALRHGEVAVLVVAGGQGTRLGFEQPKGVFPVGPVTDKTLYQIHAEKVLALRRRYGADLPLLVMTSTATDAPTRDFFAAHGHFGLPAGAVAFFRQGTMPALDLATGRLLLDAPGRVFLSPDGHGGTLTALRTSGLLNDLRTKGVRHVFYFQVDNPLVKVADPTFLGHHLARGAEVSSKVIAKLGPTDKLGNFVEVGGRCAMIEYSDLPPEVAHARDGHGRLKLWAGNPAIHLFAVDFLDRMTRAGGAMPFHLARKKVPHLDAAGNPVTPAAENALKFERFIFDVLPHAERWALVETSRREEFAPLKNATGADSPDAVEQAISDLAADWAAAAGLAVPRRPDGSAAVPLEVSPLFALDAEEFAARVERATVIDGPRLFG